MSRVALHSDGIILIDGTEVGVAGTGWVDVPSDAGWVGVSCP